MSALLDAALDTERRAECARHDEQDVLRDEQAAKPYAGPYGCRCYLCNTPRENLRSTWCSWCDAGTPRPAA